MIKKLSKHGNSLAVLIDKPILDLLNITEKTNLKITTDGSRIILEPMSKKKNAAHAISQDPKLQKIYEKIVSQYGESLKKLAEEDND